MENKEITFSNYIILFLIIGFTIFIALLCRNYYLSSIDYELNIPVIKQTLLNEINTDEVYNYVRENEDAILYIGVVNDAKCRSFEKEFNSVIKERLLEDTITYLNVSTNKTKFLKEFNKFYGTKLSSYPSLVIFDEGGVKAILSANKDDILNINDVIKFLDNNGIVSDNL